MISNIVRSMVRPSTIGVQGRSCYDPTTLLLTKAKHLLHISNRKQTTSTICALASGQGKCGIAVVRVSGPSSAAVLKEFTKSQNLPAGRKFIYRDIFDPATGDLIDSGLVLWFPKPHSFTGEDTCEFQVHGSRAVVNALLEALSSRPNVRIAEPGEFSRRAFYNNKLDLTEIEALADLIEAETSLQRKQALYNMRGSLRERFDIWKRQILTMIAEIEAYIEFSESDNVDLNIERLKQKIRDVIREMRDCIEESKKLFALKQGIQIPIYGAPNVGKSSLFNVITKSKRAIVSEVPGTTRDVLEKPYDIDGVPVVFMDTAGIRLRPDNSIENEGIIRAVETLSEPNTFIHILVASMPNLMQYKKAHAEAELGEYLKDYVTKIGLSEQLLNPDATNIQDLFRNKTMIVMNKVDLVGNLQDCTKKYPTINFVSCLTGIGIELFNSALKVHLKKEFQDGFMEHPRLNSLRQKSHLLDCILGLDKFLLELDKDHTDYTIAVGYLRKGLHNLGYITGQVVNEDILDVLFEHFCIGK